MKIRENSKKFNIFLDSARCSFIVIWPNNDISTHKKLRKILGIQPIHSETVPVQDTLIHQNCPGLNETDHQ